MRILLISFLAAFTWLPGSDARGQVLDVAEIKPEIRTGFAHAGWKYDRYSDMPSLDAQTPNDRGRPARDRASSATCMLRGTKTNR